MNIEGVILAAGFSSRTGTFKMELPFGEKKLIQQVIEEMMDSCSRVIVVGGHKIERVIRLTREYPAVQVVFNRHYERGMFSSVQEGVGHLGGDAFFIMPGDHPLVTREVYHQLIAALKSSAPGYDVFIPVFKGRKGHPVLMKKALAEEIREEPPLSTLRTVIRRRRHFLVEVDREGILLDVDTMADYKKLSTRH
jgi:molybdenum cofactor cytidylyltransferase